MLGPVYRAAGMRPLQCTPQHSARRRSLGAAGPNADGGHALRRGVMAGVLPPSALVETSIEESESTMEITQPRRLVERLYYDVWNKGDETVARESSRLTFGSGHRWDRNGQGRPGLLPTYVRSARRWQITSASSMISLRAIRAFRGIHSGEFFGVPATGQEARAAGNPEPEPKGSRCPSTSAAIITSAKLPLEPSSSAVRVSRQDGRGNDRSLEFCGQPWGWG